MSHKKEKKTLAVSWHSLKKSQCHEQKLKLQKNDGF